VQGQALRVGHPTEVAPSKAKGGVGGEGHGRGLCVQLKPPLLGEKFHVLQLLKIGLVAHRHWTLIVQVVPLVVVQSLWVLAEGAAKSIFILPRPVTFLDTLVTATVGAEVAKVATPVFRDIILLTQRAPRVVPVLLLPLLLHYWVFQEVRTLGHKQLIRLHPLPEGIHCCHTPGVKGPRYVAATGGEHG
jgi:hypothetical protein